MTVFVLANDIRFDVNNPGDRNFRPNIGLEGINCRSDVGEFRRSTEANLGRYEQLIGAEIQGLHVNQGGDVRRRLNHARDRYCVLGTSSLADE